MLVETLIAAILTTSPHLPESRAEHFATGIFAVAGDDVDRAAALVVIGRRESSWRFPVEVCATEGLGGWGTFGVANITPWRRLYPGGTCGPLVFQARAAAEIWAMHWRMEGYSAPRAFGRYIGARSVERHPEARERTRLFWKVRTSLECACSM